MNPDKILYGKPKFQFLGRRFFPKQNMDAVILVHILFHTPPGLQETAGQKQQDKNKKQNGAVTLPPAAKLANASAPLYPSKISTSISGQIRQLPASPAAMAPVYCSIKAHLRFSIAHTQITTQIKKA